MKKIFVFIVVLCIFIGGGNFSVKAESRVVKDLNVGSVSWHVINDRVINTLKENNIDFYVKNGNVIKLTKTSPDHIAYVNRVLSTSMKLGVQNNNMTIAASKYPTDWVYMKQYDRTTSKKFTKATKTAFVGAVSAWLGGVTGGAATLAKAAGAAFGGYYFVESDTQNVYHFMKYYYRELGAGKFGPTGNFMGDYQIKKVDRITKSSKGSGGQVETRYKKSTILEPFF